MRTIDADKLKKELQETLDTVHKLSGTQVDITEHCFALFEALINKAPTVKKKIKYGHRTGFNGTFCSVCGKADARAFTQKIKTCWNCGAIMREEK